MAFIAITSAALLTSGDEDDNNDIPSTDRLYAQNPPNNGTLADIGPLGIDITTDNGFDIGGTSNKAYAVLTIGSTSKLYSINITTGAATELTAFPNGVRGFAVGLGF